MRNNHIKNDEKESLWFSIIMWVIVIILIFGIINIINYFMPKEVPNSIKCKDECNKFDMEYYKINLVYNSVMCWCIDNDKKPRAIGGV